MLYYSPSEGISLWVPEIRDSSAALLLVHEIKQEIEALSQRVRTSPTNISTAVVLNGNHYKGTRVYWTHSSKPDGAKLIPSTYNMWSWLER